MKREKSLLEALCDYAQKGVAPLHMPGHKRNTALLGGDLPYALDITEIEGWDNLHDAEGILKQSMERAAAFYRSEQTYYLVGSSTAGILAGIRAATRPGDQVLVGRNCHKSVYHALELGRLRPKYLYPDFSEEWGIWGSVSVDEVERNLSDRTALVVLTSPTYEGVISDIPAIAALCHRRGIPLMVDEAHGAHLILSHPEWSGVTAGADLVVHSLHKTLPSLTQTALLHRSGDRMDPIQLQRQLAIFQTSSPSYPLMASIDRCVGLMMEFGEEWQRNYVNRLEQFDRAVADLRHLRVMGHSNKETPSAFFALDPGKLWISCRGLSLRGVDLARRLRDEYRLEPEMTAPDGVLAMTSLCDTEETFRRLADALLKLDKTLSPAPQAAAQPVWFCRPRAVCSIEEGVNAPSLSRPLAECDGAVSAEYVWAYPPGAPILVPGEEIDGDVVTLCRRMEEEGVSLHSTWGGLPSHLRVLK